MSAVAIASARALALGVALASAAGTSTSAARNFFRKQSKASYLTIESIPGVWVRGRFRDAFDC